MTNKEAIERYLERVLQDTLKAQRQLDFVASGNTQKESFVEVKPDGSEGSLNMPLYVQTNFKGIGRKPGSLPPIQAIEDWIKVKGLKLNAWAVAKNMQKKGTLVYRRKRQGIDFKAIQKKHQVQFKRDSMEAVKEELRNTINQTR